jgi:hypothetical protein
MDRPACVLQPVRPSSSFRADFQVAADHREPVARGGLSSAHLARFAAALALLVAVSLYGVTLDNRELAIARQISLQTFRADQMEARAVELRLQVQQLQSPERLRAVVSEQEKVRVGTHELGRDDGLNRSRHERAFALEHENANLRRTTPYRVPGTQYGSAPLNGSFSER